jgi:hypothetical protein
MVFNLPTENKTAPSEQDSSTNNNTAPKVPKAGILDDGDLPPLTSDGDEENDDDSVPRTPLKEPPEIEIPNLN